MDEGEKALKSHEQMVRRRFAELDKHNFGILDELFDRSYDLNLPGLPKPMDLETTKRFYRSLYTAFPDLQHDIAEQVSARDKVVTRWTARGTHKGDWMGIAATGRKITLSGINIYTVRGGLLAQSHVNWDLLGLLQQLGAVDVRLEA